MRILRILAAVVMLCGAMPLAPAHAQTLAPPPAQSSTGGFDGYRVLAVTAGIVVGAAVAVIVTDGLIIPVYAWATGGAGMGGGPGAMAAFEGAMSGEMAGQGYGVLRGGMRLLGAIGGGLYADSLYLGR